MVYVGFKANQEVYDIIKDKPNKSAFIKELILKHSEIENYPPVVPKGYNVRRISS